MKIYSNQLQNNLSNALAPVYLFSSNEPYWLMYASELVISAAEKKGFSRANKVRFTDDDLNFDKLVEALSSPGLFADNIIVEVNLSSIKGKAAQALTLIHEYLNPDLLAIVTIPQISQSELKLKTLANLDQAGITTIFYPATDQEISNLINQTSQKFGITLPIDCQILLKQTYEGNLFSLCQSIEKLSLSGIKGNISIETLSEHIENDNHFSIFAIIDTFVQSNASLAKRIRVLDSLRAEGQTVTEIISKLGSAIHTLYEIRTILDQGGNLEKFYESHPMLRVMKQKRLAYQNAANSIKISTFKQMIKLICQADILSRSFNENQAFLLLREIMALRTNDAPLFQNGTIR